MTDGDGLTYRVLLRSGGFSDAVCAKQVCILKTPQREGANKPRLTYLSSSRVSTDGRGLPPCFFLLPVGPNSLQLLPLEETLPWSFFHSSFKLKQIQTPVTSTLMLKSGEHRTAVEAYKETS